MWGAPCDDASRQGDEAAEQKTVAAEVAKEEGLSPPVDSKVKELEVYPSHLAFNVYQKGLQDVHCRRVGNATFFSVKRDWNRLVVDFPITEATKKRMLPSAFEGDARVVYEEVANSNIGASVDELWVLVEGRLCNEVHQAALQYRFLI